MGSSAITDVAVIIDGSFEGLLTVVYGFYYEKLRPCGIYEEGDFQQELGVEYFYSETDAEKAGKVQNAMIRKFHEETYGKIVSAFLSFDPKRFYSLFEYIVLCFKYGDGVENFEQIDCVRHIREIGARAGGECHKLTGFVRFSETADGILYAEVSPENFVLPMLAEYFSDRLISERFIINDRNRGLAAIYDTREWIIAEVPEETVFDCHSDEELYRKLWRAFYNSIAIKERTNRKLMLQHMPKKYHRHITERMEETEANKTVKSINHKEHKNT